MDGIIGAAVKEAFIGLVTDDIFRRHVQGSLLQEKPVIAGSIRVRGIYADGIRTGIQIEAVISRACHGVQPGVEELVFIGVYDLDPQNLVCMRDKMHLHKPCIGKSERI